MSLSTLQDRMKREPQAYTDDFQRQLRHFDAQLALLLENTTVSKQRNDTEKEFSKLVAFLAHVSPLYPQGADHVGTKLISLLDTIANVLQPDTRAKTMQALILLRRNGGLKPEILTSLCFRLFRLRDKSLRATLFSYVVKDIYTLNQNRTNHQLNSAMQNIVYKMLVDDERTAGSPAAAKRALSVVIELYKKRVWTDGRSVNVIADACFSHLPRNAVVAAKFFLGVDEEIDELLMQDEDDMDPGNTKSGAAAAAAREKEIRNTLKAPKVAKQTRKRIRAKAKAEKELKRITEGASTQDDSRAHDSAARRRKLAPRFPAIDLIHDPQTFAEKLLKLVKTSTDSFEIRLIQLNLVSRVLGHHKLYLNTFYSFCERYLQPHQTHVTQVLAAVIQASHVLVLPEDLEPIVMLLANNFINDRVGAEVMAVGLNAVRELIARVPLLTKGERVPILVNDLIKYRKYRRDRSVVIAARALLNLLRQVNPAILHRKERGKAHANLDEAKEILEYGEEKVATGVQGAEFLEDDGSLSSGSSLGDEDEDGDDDEGEWITLEHDDDNSDEDEDEDEDDDDEQDTTQPSTELPDRKRILTQEDFDKIKSLQKQKMEEQLDGNRGKNIPPSTYVEGQGTLYGFAVVRQNLQDGNDDDDEEDMKHNLQNEEGKSTKSSKRSMASSTKKSSSSTISSRKRAAAEDSDDDDDNSKDDADPSILNPHSLEGHRQKKLRALQETIDTIRLQREEHQDKRHVTNREKSKRTKNFHMVQKSTRVRSKQQHSLKQQQATVKKHIKSLDLNKKMLKKVRGKKLG